MDIIAFLLFGIWCAKLTAVINAIGWIRKNGSAYRTAFREANPQSEEQYVSLMETHEGQFVPFGVKDYKLRQMIQNATGWKARLLSWFQAWLFRYERLLVIICAYLCFAANVLIDWPIAIALKPEICQVAIFIFSILLLISNIVLAIESIHSYAILGSYAVLFHMFAPDPDPNTPHSSVLLPELYVFLGKFLTALCAAATASYLGYLFYGAFRGDLITHEAGNIFNWVASYLQFVYFSATTMFTVGYGDVVPATGLGQFVSFLIMLQGFIIIGVVFASLMSVSNAGQPPTHR